MRAGVIGFEGLRHRVTSSYQKENWNVNYLQRATTSDGILGKCTRGPQIMPIEHSPQKYHFDTTLQKKQLTSHTATRVTALAAAARNS
jgi:hypothetical protein